MRKKETRRVSERRRKREEKVRGGEREGER